LFRAYFRRLNISLSFAGFFPFGLNAVLPADEEGRFRFPPLLPPPPPAIFPASATEHVHTSKDDKSLWQTEHFYWFL
jgi:hypothetical protein